MREILTLVYCDNVALHGESKVEASVETTVGSEGREYELDLCEPCNNRLLADLAQWADMGRVVTRQRKRGRPRSAPSQG